MAVKKLRSTSARTAARAVKKPAARGAPRRSTVRPAPKPAAAPPAAAKPDAQPAPAKPAAQPAATDEAPNAIGAWHHHLDYTSHDMAGIKRFYTEVLGFTRFIEEPKVGYLSIRTTPTTSVGFMAPVPGPPEQWRPPGEPALYFFVKDVDRVHRDLVAKGVSFQEPPTDRPWGHRMAICRDPEGRMVCLAQDPSRG